MSAGKQKEYECVDCNKQLTFREAKKWFDGKIRCVEHDNIKLEKLKEWGKEYDRRNAERMRLGI